MAGTMMNVRAVATRLGVHENTVRNWEARGILHAVRLPVSGYRRFDEREVERFSREMRTHCAPADEGPTIDAAPLQGTIHHGDID